MSDQHGRTIGMREGRFPKSALEDATKVAGLLAVSGLLAFCLGYIQTSAYLSGMGVRWAISLMSPAQIAMRSGILFAFCLTALPIVLVLPGEKLRVRQVVKAGFLALMLLCVSVFSLGYIRDFSNFGFLLMLMLACVTAMTGIRTLIWIWRYEDPSSDKLVHVGMVLGSLILVPTITGSAYAKRSTSPGLPDLPKVQVVNDSGADWRMVTPVGDKLLIERVGENGKAVMFRIVLPENVLVLPNKDIQL